MNTRKFGILALALLALINQAQAVEMLLDRDGRRTVKHSMTIESFIGQAIELEEHAENLPREKSDGYIVTHIKAASANPFGFSKFAWIPLLKVDYTIEKLDSPWRTSGTHQAAIGKFGPHYGSNIKLDGMGKYRYTVRVSPPAKGQLRRLTDIENGVQWWEPFEVSWDFTWTGLGKMRAIGAKGGY